MRFTFGLSHYLMIVDSKLLSGVKDDSNYLHTRNVHSGNYFKHARTFRPAGGGSEDEVNEQAEKLLLSLTGKLRSFITTKEFFVDGFEREAENLGKEKLRIEELLGTIFPSTSTMNKLWFVQQMYEYMFKSIQSLKFFNMKREISSYFVHELITLNIKLYLLFDDEGKPDHTVENFADKVRDYERYVNNIGSAYEELPQKPVMVKLYYETQFNRVKSRLRILSTYPLRLNSSTTLNVPFPYNLPWLIIGNQSLQNFASFLPWRIFDI